ncbi:MULTISPECIES: SHOCT domain-containing protein [unclassified Geodermatophilus]
MPLLRGMARTAIVAGTATAVSNRVSRRQGRRWAEQQAAAPPEPQYGQPQYGQPAPQRTDTNTKLAQLRELAQLRDSGVLDEAEFELQKSQILNS